MKLDYSLSYFCILYLIIFILLYKKTKFSFFLKKKTRYFFFSIKIIIHMFQKKKIACILFFGFEKQRHEILL